MSSLCALFSVHWRRSDGTSSSLTDIRIPSRDRQKASLPDGLDKDMVVQMTSLWESHTLQHWFGFTIEEWNDAQQQCQTSTGDGSSSQQTLVIVGNAQVYLITLPIAVLLTCDSEPAQYQDPETEAAKWKSAITNCIIYTYIFLLWQRPISHILSTLISLMNVSHWGKCCFFLPFCPLSFSVCWNNAKNKMQQSKLFIINIYSTVN